MSPSLLRLRRGALTRSAPAIVLALALASAARGPPSFAAVRAAPAATTAWTIQSTPPTSGNFSQLLAVSCGSPTACIAAGTEGTAAAPQPLAERWQGGEWTIQSLPLPHGSSLAVLTGLSCPSATACTAVGYYQASSGAQKVLAMHWNGVKWTIQPTPDPAGDGPVLDAVSCASPTACQAVGDYSTDSGVQKALAEQWNGTAWSVQAILARPAASHP